MPSSAPELLAAAVESALGAPALIRPADPRFGDYQANGIMAAAKQRGENPRALAEKIITQLDVAGICEPPTIAGPGFINFRLKPDFVAQQIEHFSKPAVANPKTIVIDFSSPNVAKPMHVGHIRSTIIGDCLARVARFLGHHVITDNHIGDWGTQFGMLIVGWKKHRDDAALARDPIGELERLYKFVNEHGDREQAKSELVKLQQGDAENRAIWDKIIELSRQEFEKVYRRLGVTFDHTLGESFYNPMLPAVVAELRQRGLAVESEGAIAVFLDAANDSAQRRAEGTPPDQETPVGRGAPTAAQRRAPVIIQKADGGFLYATTDLATLRYRMEQWKPDEIVYVTDARQKLHFEQLFEIARKWFEKTPDLRHVYFGSILGEDGKPLKTREGAPVKLSELLDEAEQRALKIVTAKNPELPEDARRQIARAVGIGAVKYADLSQNRTTDYVFSWDKMLAMTGNTAPYLQYAYVRIQSIFRRSELPVATGRSLLQHPAELDLAKQLLRFAETLHAVLEDDKPNWLTGYLYDLTGKFSAFYENCPVLQSAEPTRSARLKLCRLTADVIKRGLDLLGIDVIEQM